MSEALSAIQTGTNPGQVVEAIKSRRNSSESTPKKSSTHKTSLRSESRPVFDWGRPGSSTQSLQSASPAYSNALQTDIDRSAHQSPGSAGLTQLSRTVDSLEDGVRAFFTCTSCIFHIYDPDEAQQSLSTIRPHLENSGKSWLELVFQGSIPTNLKPTLCSLCIMAAVGLQYTKNPIPALGFESSRSDGAHEFVSIFYESARHLLETVIETNILEAMKVCAALCIFNTIGHATVAVAYADMGINFVLNLGPSLKYCPTNLSEVAWVEYKRVARTLVTLRSWLVSTLGYVHSDNPTSQTDIHWLIDHKNLTPNEVIQQELNKVVQIEANLLRTIDSFRDISPALLSSTRRDLAQWYHELPAWMHLSALFDNNISATSLRRNVFLVHLFYLSASLLLARLAHGGNKSEFPRYDIEEVRISAADGVHAARTTAHILQLQMDERAIFQRCWCCLYVGRIYLHPFRKLIHRCRFAAYMSCLVLLHSTAQMQLHHFPQSTWQKELSYAGSCLDVLDYGAEANKVAVRFAEVTRGYYNTLSAQIQPEKDISVAEASENFDYLFMIPSTSPLNLAQVSRELLKHVSCPFGSPSSLRVEGTLKAGLGAHVTLPFNRTTPDSEKSWSAVEMALSGMPTGEFVGSSQPHGWDAFPDLKTM